MCVWSVILDTELSKFCFIDCALQPTGQELYSRKSCLIGMPSGIVGTYGGCDARTVLK